MANATPDQIETIKRLALDGVSSDDPKDLIRLPMDQAIGNLCRVALFMIVSFAGSELQ